nr:unnamed protein product [Meloidogyne enterolobii]
MGKYDPTAKGCRLLKIVFGASKFQRITLAEWKRHRVEMKKEAKWSRLLIRPSLTREQLEAEKIERTKKREEYNKRMSANNSPFYKCLYFNSRSLVNKLDALRLLLISKSFKIICVSESWLNKKIDNSQILHSTSYSIVRCDRGSRGGGACILVDNIVPFSPVKTPKNKNSDVVAIDIYSPKFDKFRIITVYRPTTNENLNDFQEFLETLSYLISINHNYIIVGDFNFPNLIWKNNIPLALNHKSPSEKLFIEFVENFNLIQEISSPTRQNNYLDLLFSPSTSRVAKNVTINAPFKNSDHNTIEFNLNFDCFPKEPEFIYDFHNADYNQINNILIGLNWNTLFINCTNVDSQYTLFLEIIHQIIQNFIPLKTINKDFAKFPKHIQKMISYKNLLWKNINKPAIREKYILTQQKIDKEISRFLKNREISKFNDSRSRFQYIGAFLKSKKTKIPIFNINNQFTILAKDKAECLAKQFQSVFNSSNFDSSDIKTFNKNTLSFIDINPEEIYSIMSKLDNVNNISPDGIPNIFLKNTATSLTIPLTIIFNMSIMTSKIPTIWKKSIIRPIPKNNNPNEPKDFRPISLLCSTSKILERIISNKLTSFLETNNYLPTCQHGFRKNHSVITQLLETYNDYTLAIENKKCVDVVFFDLAKAFDTVPHDRLLKKLHHLGITSALLNWIEDYLLNRTFTVLVESNNSNEYPITSGVPQGSTLGPILFISYIFDLIDFCKTDNVTPKLFADDLKAYTCFDFSNKNHYSPLQTFIQKFSKYCEINGLKIAISKCSSFHIGTKNPFHQYSLLNTNIPIIPPNKHIRDLGIYFTSNLKWDSHIKIATNKATRIYYTLIRSLKTNNTQFLITLFKIYVLPILEFGSPIINPYLNKDINALENVQHKFLT